MESISESRSRFEPYIRRTPARDGLKRETPLCKRGFEVRPGRLELPRGKPPTRPSTLRVYQFRHRRVNGADYRPGTGALTGVLAVVRHPRYLNEHMFDSATQSDRDGGARWWS